MSILESSRPIDLATSQTLDENDADTSISSGLSSFSYESSGNMISPDFRFKTPKKIIQTNDEEELIQGPFSSTPPQQTPVYKKATSKLMKQSSKKTAKENKNLYNFGLEVPLFQQPQTQPEVSTGTGGWFWGKAREIQPSIYVPFSSSSSNFPPPPHSLSPPSAHKVEEEMSRSPPPSPFPSFGFSNGSTVASPSRRGKDSKSNNFKKSPPGGVTEKLTANNTVDIVNAQMFKKQGKLDYENENYEQALDAFSKCLGVAPVGWVEIPGILGNRAATYMMLERFVEAIDDCDQAFLLMPNMLRLQDRKARAQLKLGQFLLAENSFTFLQTSLANPLLSPSKSNLELTRTANLGLAQISESRMLYNKLLSTDTSFSSDFKSVYRLVEELLVFCPQFRTAQAFKVNALCKLQRWEEAKAYGEHVVLSAHSTIRDLFAFKHKQGSVYDVPTVGQLKWVTRKISNSQVGLEIDRNAICGAMLCMGPEMSKVYLVSLKNLDICRNFSNESMIELVSVLTLLYSVVVNDSSWTWVLHALTSLQEVMQFKSQADEKFRAGHFTDSILCYTEALQKDPEAHRWNAVLYCNRAAAYMNVGKYTDAINDCHQSLARDSTYHSVLLRRARAYRAGGHVILSTRDYRKYLSSKPRPVDSESVENEMDEMLEIESGDFASSTISNEGVDKNSNQQKEELESTHFKSAECDTVIGDLSKDFDSTFTIKEDKPLAQSSSIAEVTAFSIPNVQFSVGTVKKKGSKEKRGKALGTTKDLLSSPSKLVQVDDDSKDILSPMDTETTSREGMSSPLPPSFIETELPSFREHIFQFHQPVFSAPSEPTTSANVLYTTAMFPLQAPPSFPPAPPPPPISLNIPEASFCMGTSKQFKQKKKITKVSPNKQSNPFASFRSTTTPASVPPVTHVHSDPLLQSDAAPSWWGSGDCSKHDESFIDEPVVVESPKKYTSFVCAAADQLKNQGKLDYENENYEQALDAFSKCLGVAPVGWVEIPGVLGNRAATYMMLERFVEAIDDCDQALMLMPNMLRLQDRKARAQIKLGYFAEADVAYQALLEYCNKSCGTSKYDNVSKQDVQRGMKELIDARVLSGKLSASCGPGNDGKKMLALSEELLVFCPQFRTAQAFKVNALCKLQRWEEAKAYGEHVVLSAHSTIRDLFAFKHKQGSVYDVPTVEQLKWVTRKISNSQVGLEIDRNAIFGAMLCMGPEMSKVYLVSLKNLDICRNFSNETMDILLNVLNRLSVFASEWTWLKACIESIKTSITTKSQADEKFRAGHFTDSILCYTEALQKDPEAHRWNAVLYCNRAAAYMNVGKYTDAISDCHQSLARDSTYQKALLRLRGRAHYANGNVSSAIFDLRKYLAASPRPADAQTVGAELDNMLDEQLQSFNRGGSKSNTSQSKGRAPNLGRNQQQGNSRRHENAAESDEDFTSFYARFKSGGYKEKGENPKEKFSSRHVPPPPPPRQERSTAPPPPPCLDKDLSKETDLYILLGIEVTATEKEIKTSYRKLALKYHPDKNKEKSAEDMFKAISSAYATLSDKVSRYRYDLTRPNPNIYGRRR